MEAQRGALRTADAESGIRDHSRAHQRPDRRHAGAGGRPGDAPTAQQPLTTIVPLDPIWVRFKVTESQYLAFKKRGTLDRNRPSRWSWRTTANFPHKGRIENTLNQVDPKTGTLELQASFPNPQHTLLPGQFGKVRVETELRKNVVLVPQRAIQQLQSMQTVYDRGAGNKVELRPITTAERVGENWIVTAGLKPGDRVIVEGQLNVRPGHASSTPARIHADRASAAANPSWRRFFIDRPVFAIVIAIVIVILGAVAIPNLPIATYPGSGAAGGADHRQLSGRQRHRSRKDRRAAHRRAARRPGRHAVLPFQQRQQRIHHHRCHVPARHQSRHRHRADAEQSEHRAAAAASGSAAAGRDGEESFERVSDGGRPRFRPTTATIRCFSPTTRRSIC